MENRDDQNKGQTGQQGQSTDKQNQQGFGQQDTPSAGEEGRTGSDQGAFGKSGGTTFAQGQTGQLDKQDKQRSGETASDKGFVGTSKEKDTSEAYLSEDETGQTDFAEQGQGASEAPTGTAANQDIESGASPTRDATLDDGS
jgi:hypothetical protein